MRKKRILIGSLAAAVVVGSCILTLVLLTRETKLSEIVITAQPDRTMYYEGEVFSPVGMVINAKYSDKTTKKIDVEDCVYKKSGLDLSDKQIVFTYTEGAVTKSAQVDLTVSELRYSNENIGRINDLVQDISPQFEEYPETYKEIKKTGVLKILAALKKALIFDEEVTAMLNAVDSVVGAEGRYMVALIKAIVETDVSDAKKSIFLWEMIAGVRDITEKLIIEADAGLSIMIDIYDVFISQERENFIVSMTAFFEVIRGAGDSALWLFNMISALSSGSDSAMLAGISQFEFVSIVLSIKTDILNSLDVLSPEVFSAAASMAKVFVPFATKDLTNEFLINERDSYIEELRSVMAQIIYYEGVIEELELTDPSGSEYQNAKKALDELNNEFTHILNEISRLNSIINKDYRSQLNNDIIKGIDVVVSDYAVLHTSLRASIDAINKNMIAAVYDSLVNDEDINTETLAIVFAKMLYAGLNAQGGVSKDSSKVLIIKYVELLDATFRHWVVISDNDYKTIIADTFDSYYNDISALYLINDYKAELGFEFADNLIVHYIKSLFATAA